MGANAFRSMSFCVCVSCSGQVLHVTLEPRTSLVDGNYFLFTHWNPFCQWALAALLCCFSWIHRHLGSQWCHFFKFSTYHLDNLTMEPRNHLFEKWTHLPKTIIFKFHVNLPGCINGTEENPWTLPLVRGVAHPGPYDLSPYSRHTCDTRLDTWGIGWDAWIVWGGADLTISHFTCWLANKSYQAVISSNKITKTREFTGQCCWTIIWGGVLAIQIVIMKPTELEIRRFDVSRVWYGTHLCRGQDCSQNVEKHRR